MVVITYFLSSIYDTILKKSPLLARQYNWSVYIISDMSQGLCKPGTSYTSKFEIPTREHGYTYQITLIFMEWVYCTLFNFKQSENTEQNIQI